MPRKTDMPLEETAVSTPLRRSARKTSVNSPALSTLTTGKITQSQTETTSKTKPALLPQESSDQEEVVKKQPATRGRRASSSKEDSEPKPEPARTRSRRSSTASESAVEEEPRTQPITRRRRSSATESTVSESLKPVRSRRNSATEKSTAEEPAKSTRTRRSSTKDEPKEEPVKRITRSRRNSADKAEEIEPSEKKPNTRARRSSTDELNSASESKAIKLTPVKSRRRPLAVENAANLEPIVELELELKGRQSQSPVVEKPVTSHTSVESPKRTELKTNLNLSVINEATEETLNNENKNKTGEVTPRRSPRLSKQKPPEELTTSTTPSSNTKTAVMENKSSETENVEGQSKSKEENLKSCSQKLDFDGAEMESKTEENVDQNQQDLLDTSKEQQKQNKAMEVIEEKLEKVSFSKTSETENCNISKESNESSKLHMNISTSQTESADEKEDDLNSSKSSSTSDKENINTNVFSSPTVKKAIPEENQVLATLTNEDSDDRNSTKEIVKETAQSPKEISLPLEESSPVKEESPQLTKGGPGSAEGSPSFMEVSLHSVEESPLLIKESPQSVKEISQIMETETKLEKSISEDERFKSPHGTKQSTEQHEALKDISPVKQEEKMFMEESNVSQKESEEEMNLSKPKVSVKEFSDLEKERKNEKVEEAFDNLERLLDQFENRKETPKKSLECIKSKSNEETTSYESYTYHSTIEGESTDDRVYRMFKHLTDASGENSPEKQKSKQFNGPLHENTFDSMESPATKNLRISDIEAEVRRSVSPVMRGKSKSPQPVITEKTSENVVQATTSDQPVAEVVDEANKTIISDRSTVDSSDNLLENSKSTNRVQLKDGSENEIEQSVTEDIESKASPSDFKGSLKSFPSVDYEFDVPSDEEESEKTHAPEYDESTVVASFMTSTQTVGDVTVSTEMETVMSFNTQTDHPQTSKDSSHFESKEETSKLELDKETANCNGIKTCDNAVISEENGVDEELETDSFGTVDPHLLQVRAEVQKIIMGETSSSEFSEKVDAAFMDGDSETEKQNGDSLPRSSKSCAIGSSSGVGREEDDSVNRNVQKIVKVLEDIQLKGTDTEKDNEATNDLTSKSEESRINIDLSEADWEIIEESKDKDEDGNEISSIKKLKKGTEGAQDTECEAEDIKKGNTTEYDLESEPVEVEKKTNLCEDQKNVENKEDENEIVIKKKSEKVVRSDTELEEEAERDHASSNDDQASESPAIRKDGNRNLDTSDISLKKLKKRSTGAEDMEFENNDKKNAVDDLTKSKKGSQKRKSDKHAENIAKQKKSKKIKEDMEDVEKKRPKKKTAKKNKLSIISLKSSTSDDDLENIEESVRTVVDKSTKIKKSGNKKLENETENLYSSESDSEVFKSTEESSSKNLDSSKRPSLSIVDEFVSKKIREMASEEESCEEEEDDADETNDFLCTMAEEGEEDTPSEDSNAIVDEGESLGSTDSEIDFSNDEYDNDSFICDDENEQLLSGEEYDLEDAKTSKKKKSRIIQLDSYDDDVIKIERKQKATPFKRKRIISISDSSESDEHERESDEHEDANCEELKISVENSETQEVICVADKTDEVIVETKPSADNQEASSNLKPDPSPGQQAKKKRLSSITLHENINVKEIKDAPLSGRIINIVDSFCTTMRKGEISMNLSIECSAQDSNDSGDEQQGNVEAKKKPGSASPGERKTVNKEQQAVEEELHFELPRRLSVSMDDSDLTESKRAARKRRKLSKSMSNLDQFEPVSKKKKINKKKDVGKHLVKNPEIDTRLKNRPRRVVKPSTNMNDSWFTEVAHVVPSTSAFDKQEKAAYKAGKVHPKDFRSQMLNDPSRVRRVETKTMLKKKGMYL